MTNDVKPMEFEAFGNKFVFNADGTVFRGTEKIYPVLTAVAAVAGVLSAETNAGPMNMDMLYEIFRITGEGKPLENAGILSGAYKVTHPDGIIEVIDPNNQPGYYNYLKPQKGVPVEGSIDELLAKQKKQDDEVGGTYPPKNLLSREAKNIIFGKNRPEMQGVKGSLGISWNWLPSSPGNSLARGFHSGNGDEDDYTRYDNGRARLSRSFPPSPQGVGG